MCYGRVFVLNYLLLPIGSEAVVVGVCQFFKSSCDHLKRSALLRASGKVNRCELPSFAGKWVGWILTLVVSVSFFLFLGQQSATKKSLGGVAPYSTLFSFCFFVFF